MGGAGKAFRIVSPGPGRNQSERTEGECSDAGSGRNSQPAIIPQPVGSPPPMTVMPAIAATGVLAGGGFMVRRWWIRRQDPARFREYE
jgi:hypothetical protein